MVYSAPGYRDPSSNYNKTRTVFKIVAVQSFISAGISLELQNQIYSTNLITPLCTFPCVIISSDNISNIHQHNFESTNGINFTIVQQPGKRYSRFTVTS